MGCRLLALLLFQRKIVMIISSLVISFMFCVIKSQISFMFLVSDKMHRHILGDGGYIPSNIWQGGKAYVIIPQCCEKLTRFCSKNGWFLMIPAKFYQKFLLKYKILVSQAQRTVFFLLITCSKFVPKCIHQIDFFFEPLTLSTIK